LPHIGAFPTLEYSKALRRVVLENLTSVITSKAANRYQFKTGHSTSVRDKSFYSFGVRSGKDVFDASVFPICVELGPCGKCGKRFVLSKRLWESVSRSCRSGHRIRFPRLRHFPQASVFGGCVFQILLARSKKTSPGSLIDNDRRRGRLPAWPVFHSFTSGCGSCVRVRQLRGPHFKT
jgi:hypothetical protein